MDTSDSSSPTQIAIRCVGTYVALTLTPALMLALAFPRDHRGFVLVLTIVFVGVPIAASAALSAALWFPFFFAGRVTSRWKQLVIYLATAFAFFAVIYSQMTFEGP